VCQNNLTGHNIDDLWPMEGMINFEFDTS